MQQALVEYIFNALWQVPMIAGAAWLLVKSARPGPRAQYLLWLSVLAASLLLPLAHLGTVNRPGPLTPGTAAATAPAAAQMPGRSATIKEPSRGHISALPRTVHVRADYGRWLVRLYLGCLLLGFLRLVRGWQTAHRLVAHSQKTQQYREPLANASQRLGVKLPSLRESAEISSPMVVGAVHPVLLLPQGFQRFSEAEIRAAFCHELAHIKRQDFLVNAICQLAALPLIWHPVLNAIEQRIYMTREMICDAMAAAELESKFGYARCLLTLAQSMLASPHAAGEAQVLSLFGNHTLEERMMRLTETTTVRVRLQAARIAAGATMMLAAGVVATLFHVTPTMAQASPPQEPIQKSPAAPAEAAATVSKGNKVSSRKRAGTAAQWPRPEPALQLHTDLAQQQTDKIKLVFDSAQLKRQIEDAQNQASRANALINSPQFKQQMEEAQRQASIATALIDSPEFKRQLEEAQRQASTAKALIDSPPFKQQIENARREASKAKALIDSPEFKQQLEEARRQASKVQAIFDDPKFKRQIENIEKELKQADHVEPPMK